MQQNIPLTGTGTVPPLTITWSTPAPITYDTPLSGTQLNATASVAGTFMYNPLAGAVTVVQVTLQVNQATPVISWSPAPLEIDSKLGAATWFASFLDTTKARLAL